MVSENYALMLSCGIAIIGWIISFAGLCASGTLPSAVSWWIAVYELIVVVVVCTIVCTNTLYACRSMILALAAISVPYVTDEISKHISAGVTPLSIASAGYIFTWIFILGIQHESAIQLYPSATYNGTFPNSLATVVDMAKAAPDAHSTATGHQTQPPYPPTPFPAHEVGPAPGQQQQPTRVPMYLPNPPTHDQEETVFVSPHAEYSIPVVALHSCKYLPLHNHEANPEDPNELSFKKGEKLHVHERKGNWWQARKADGLVGMIPSNYVTPVAE
ncbi:hypothetical protein VTP01DRAFT_2615 [Rhizomucor pusillus]|uniref:uncharacterized protein n=1 Tax=Rhizomucor pusillus TaxID=4840 RepID=UPI0037438ECE